jgi:ankyrin repeat protein
MEKSKGKIRHAFTTIKKRLFSKRQPKVEEKPEALEARRKHELFEMLKKAVIMGDERKAGLAIRAGADVNGIDPGLNMTPLMYAAFDSNPKMCRFLMQNGADAEKLNYSGINAFTYAAKENPTAGGKSARHRIATCFALAFMGPSPIVKEREWTADNLGYSFWPNIPNTSDLVNLAESKEMMFQSLGASAKPFTDSFFSCIYGN